MATTPHVGLTLVEQAQAQKEVTVNMALMRLDALLNTGVIDKDLSAPPAGPAEGDVYIVASGATGDWAGHDGEVAYFEQVWRFITPNEGLVLWVRDEGQFYLYGVGGWEAGMSGVQSMVNTQTSAAYTLISSDAGKIVEGDNASAITLTLPNSLPKGFTCDVVQKGGGLVSFSAASGASYHNRFGHSKTAGQYARCRLYVSSNADGNSAVYVLTGDTQA